MRALLSLCVALVVLWSTVLSEDHSLSHGAGHDHHDDHVNNSLRIYEENGNFAFSLYKHISALRGSQSQNVFFSPLSISVALSALSMGARGKTHQQLFEGLGFNATDITAEEVSQSFQSILENLNNKTEMTVSVGNALFINETFKPFPEFLENMKRYYYSEGFSTDFRKTEEAKEQINKYVEEKTGGKIAKILDEVDPLSVMYLISYIYFKGEWEIPFSSFLTKTEDFHVDDHTTVPVEMMVQERDFPVYYDEAISTHVLQLHYKGSASMLLVLPEKGLQGLEEVVCRKHFRKWMRSLTERTYTVHVPKLSIETSYQLKEVLYGMGITDIFEDADLTGISEERDLLVSKVVHKATLDVNEAGTVATAATGIEITTRSMMFPPTPVLKFDRPFMVFVINHDTRTSPNEGRNRPTLFQLQYRSPGSIYIQKLQTKIPGSCLHINQDSAVMNSDLGDGVVTTLPLTTELHKEWVDENSSEYHDRNMAPDLRQDFNMMEQRKRVSMILQSLVFCDELEMMIQDQLKKGNNPTSLLALQQIADFMTASIPTMYPSPPQGGMAAVNMSLGMVTPVNDLRGSDSIAYDKGEKLLRCKLAAFYRLTDLFSWSQLIYNNLTVRLSSEQDHFLIVPFGLLYSEVTASSLVKINLKGEIVDRGSTNLGVNQAGFTLHSAIYTARPDVRCIVHIHTPAGAAVSAMKCGLLPISPEALSLGEVAYHNYHGILVNEEESELIQKNLGPKSKVLILRNRGLVSVGETVEEAFYYIHNLVTACEIQVHTLASTGGPDRLVMLDPEKYKARVSLSETNGNDDSYHPKWKVGEQEFEAHMRMLDNLGYRTGYPYCCPSLRDKGKKSSDTEFPPSAMRYSYMEDCESDMRSSPRRSFQRQRCERKGWLNMGQPDKAFEEGLDKSSPKAKTKVWTNITHHHVKPLLRSLSSGVCVPSCITNCLWTKEETLRQTTVANQFVPLYTNPKEVQEMRNKIRGQNLLDIKTAGPQSHLLSGAVMEHTFVQKVTAWQDAPLSDCTDTIDGLDFSEQTNSSAKSFRKGELVTGSKAIIRKEYQPCTIVSKTGPNPFKQLTDQDLEDYHKEVEYKQKISKDQVQEKEKEAKEEILNHIPVNGEDGDGSANEYLLPQVPAGDPK
ncbi:hypothetical protein AGOR_G00050260 [Albula goreensis]|uniref:Alpha-adducin n=1 Tax=Albula goreensis TaxID=1534307 RepID=A0A8T3DSR4_9TELE|nr:hypothetical protein AGOR_G00050260 [Albula goreensis]